MNSFSWPVGPNHFAATPINVLEVLFGFGFNVAYNYPVDVMSEVKAVQIKIIIKKSPKIEIKKVNIFKVLV